MVALVTLQQAKRHLRILHDDEDEDLLDKIQQASEIVIDYIQRPELEWIEAVGDTPSDAPFRVQSAVLMVLNIVWDNRSGGDIEYGQADGYLSRPITAILHRIARLSYA